MDHFNYRSGELFAENVAVEDIARRFGTPAYVYSAPLSNVITAPMMMRLPVGHTWCATPSRPTVISPC